MFKNGINYVILVMYKISIFFNSHDLVLFYYRFSLASNFHV